MSLGQTWCAVPPTQIQSLCSVDRLLNLEAKQPKQQQNSNIQTGCNIEKKYIDVSEEEEPLWGILKYGNKQLEKLNVYPGDRISFQPNSEYEFNIDDEKLYRMYTSNITLKNGHESN